LVEFVGTKVAKSIIRWVGRSWGETCLTAKWMVCFYKVPWQEIMQFVNPQSIVSATKFVESEVNHEQTSADA